MSYTPAEIYNLARIAATKSRFMMTASDMTYRVDVGWSAIVEEIYTSDTRPDERHLIYVATSAISDEVRQIRRNSGQDTSGRLDFAPRFWTYWEPIPRSGPEHSVVDRVALHQIWASLTQEHQNILEAVSLFDSHEKAASSLGMSVVEFNNKLRYARARFFKSWHEGETPSTVWRKTLKGKRRTECRRGHELSDDNVVWRGSPGNRRRTCKTCVQASRQRYKERQKAA